MGKFNLKNLGREAERIGKQVEKVVERATDQAEAAFTRAALDDERKRAQQALESSEAATTETNKLILEVNDLFNKAGKLPQPELSDIKDPNVVAQFKLAAEKFENIKQLQAKLQQDSAEMQRLYQTVRDNRGILSPFNDAPVADNAVEAGKEACKIAETTAATIQTMLVQVRQDAEACTNLLNEYGRLMTGGNPEAVNRFLIGVNKEQGEKIRELEAKLQALQRPQGVQLQGATPEAVRFQEVENSRAPDLLVLLRRNSATDGSRLGEQNDDGAASSSRMTAPSQQN